MTREEFKDYFSEWYNFNNDKTADEKFINAELYKIEKSETEGDFVFDDEFIILGKYYHSYKICSTGIELHFVIYGIGRKCNITESDYELENYSEKEYIIL